MLGELVTNTGLVSDSILVLTGNEILANTFNAKLIELGAAGINGGIVAWTPTLPREQCCIAHRAMRRGQETERRRSSAGGNMTASRTTCRPGMLCLKLPSPAA